MAYIVDIILVAIFALTVLISAKKGFFRSFIDFAGSMIAVLIARTMSATYAKNAFDSFIAPGAEKLLAQNLGQFGTTDYTQQVDNAINSLPEGLDGILQIMGIDSQTIMEQAATEGVNLNGDNLVETLMNTVVTPIGTAVLQFILFVIFAIALIFLIRVFGKIFDKIFKKLPVIKGLNKSLGAVFGILRGLITVVIVSMLISIIVSFTNSDNLITSVDNSIIVNAVSGTVSSLIGMNF